MKVAIIFFKGIDGCGVTRFGFEHHNWLNANDHQCDIFSYEKGYIRAKAHGSLDDVKWFVPSTFKDHISALNGYDVVMVNSWPSKKECSPHDFDSYYEGLLKITKPIKVGMMHEIKGCNYNRIMQLPLWLTAVDQVISFDMGVDFFKKAVDNWLPEIKPFCSGYTIPMDDKSMEKMFVSSVKKVPFEDKATRMTYFGRWTTMKDPSRLLDIKDIVVNDPKHANFLDVLMIGLDWSIGAKYDIVDHPYAKCFKGAGYKQYIRSWDHLHFDRHDPKKGNVYAAIERELAFEVLAQSMFGASFYKLKEREKHNYGNRMEYTQMELCCLTVPVFDIHWGKNNYHNDGNSFFDHGEVAIWSDRQNLDGTIEKMKEISADKKMFNRYRKTAFLACRDCYASSRVIPSFYEKIFETGKNTNKTSKEAFLERVFEGLEVPENVNLDFNRLHKLHKMVPKFKTTRGEDRHNGYTISLVEKED
jgi:hypothetical protein